jgi:hypothetical protein
MISGLRYAFGITLWELYTSAYPFSKVPEGILGYQITIGFRPEFPAGTPVGFKDLAQR